MVNSDSRFTSSQQPIEAALGPKSQSGMSQQNQLSTINQSQLGLSGNSATHNSPSPPGSKSATPSPSSSAHEDDNDDGLRVTTHRHMDAASSVQMTHILLGCNTQLCFLLWESYFNNVMCHHGGILHAYQLDRNQLSRRWLSHTAPN